MSSQWSLSPQSAEGEKTTDRHYSPASVRGLAVHSTHEAAEQIAGIGAVLQGMLPEPSYMAMYPRTLLAGPHHMPDGRHPLKTVLFDSDAKQDSSSLLGGILRPIADRFGTRIVFGQREVVKGTAVDVLLVCPCGIKRDSVERFEQDVKRQFRFDLQRYESYPAVKFEPDKTLERLLKFYRAAADNATTGYPDWLPPEQSLKAPGGVRLTDGRAVFPEIKALDSFQNFAAHSHYVVELQFYFFAGPVIWEAVKRIVCEYYQVKPNDVTLFCHDWLAIPPFWAMLLDEFRPREQIYFAHEARICRMLVEGNIKDKMAELSVRCHPDGHDASFYSYLDSMTAKDATLDDAFPEIARATEGGAFHDIFYHVLNQQAQHFDLVAAVGENVKKETELVLRGQAGCVPIVVCPNGVPNPRVTLEQIEAARDRIAGFVEHHFSFRPDHIFTSVGRYELSKGPWRNVEFYRCFAERNPDSSSILIWLSRPRPLPTESQIKYWQAWDIPWPLDHRPASQGGDLRAEEQCLWDMIKKFNGTIPGDHRILYINQFGWQPSDPNSPRPLGTFDLQKTTFTDLRVGADVGLGLAVYEPFGISPVHPFGVGAICVISDASGCALQLQRLAGNASDSFVVGRFAASCQVAPDRVDLHKLRDIENTVYGQILDELDRKLRVPREERYAAAQRVLPQLSWKRSVEGLIKEIVERDRLVRES